MGGSGGGASGAVSYPSYMTIFHQEILNHTGSDHPNTSFIEAFNLAYGNSPFASALAFNPDTLVASMNTAVTALSSAIASLDHTVDSTIGVGISRTNYPLGTTTLDTTTINPITVNPITINPITIAPATIAPTTIPPVTVTTGDLVDDIAGDIAAMDTIFTDQIEQEELPKFRAGMLNINAIHSSAYIIGEALIRASKDKALIKYGTDLQLKINEQVREINSRIALTQAEIDSRIGITQGEINSRISISQAEVNSRISISQAEINSRLTTTQEEINSRLVITQAEVNSRHVVTQSEINARHSMAKKEIDAKFYIHREELVRMATSEILAELMKKTDLTYQHAHMNAEVQRLSILAKKEQQEEQLAIDESDGKWDIELFRYAGIILAAPSGGVAQGNEKKSRATSALAGALSGAATGAMIGAPTGVGAPLGAAIGAVAGIGLSFLQ